MRHLPHLQSFDKRVIGFPRFPSRLSICLPVSSQADSAVLTSQRKISTRSLNVAVNMSARDPIPHIPLSNMTHLLLIKPCPYAIDLSPEGTLSQAMLTENTKFHLTAQSLLYLTNTVCHFLSARLQPTHPTAHTRGGMVTGSDKRYLSNNMSHIYA